MYVLVKDRADDVICGCVSPRKTSYAGQVAPRSKLLSVEHEAFSFQKFDISARGKFAYGEGVHG